MRSILRKVQARPVMALFAAVVSLALILICAGIVYQQVSLHRDRRLNPMPGQLVDVGGYRMHLFCLGSGSPTVILESGLGDTWLAWYKVQPDIAKFTRVCSYDRAGMGWSDSSPKPRNALAIAEELHRLLQKAGVPGPYLLVGHSLGGMYVRMFATLNREEVNALVLVDSVTPNQDDRLPSWVGTYNDRYLRGQTLKEDAMFFGLTRWMGWCGNGSPEIQPMMRTVDCRVGPWNEHLAEYSARQENSDEVSKAAPLGNLPVVVMSEDPEKPITAPGSGLSLQMAQEFSQDWNMLQSSLTHISTDSCRLIAKGSGHNIQTEQPDLVTAVVRNMVEHFRASTVAQSAPVTAVLQQFGCAP